MDRLQPGANVLIAARTGNSEWLLLDDDAAGERWVRRNAVQEASPLASIPVRDVTATPQPSPTPTPDSEETPTPGEGVPDFAPSDARFVFGTSGRPAIRISIVNSGADFTGPVVVEAGMSSGSLVSSQLVFDLSLRSGRVATVDFELAGAVPDRTDISVSIDPGNAVRESNEDNNSVTFTSVAAPLDPPELLIDGVSVSGTTVNVTVINIGGALPESQVSVRVSVGGGQATQSATASLETNGTLNFTVEAPGTGTGTVQVLIDGATAASRSIEVGTAEPTVTETATTTTTATAEVTPSPTTVA